MIETPAAAIMSDELAKHADFFSIGTNDLTQYTLAADRQNPQLAKLCRENTEGLMRLVSLTVANAHRAGIWVGVCGELAAEADFIEKFLNMGVDELSVAPSLVLHVREQIIETQ
jgi:phosphotransferase system enzyme I (PtsI)